MMDIASVIIFSWTQSKRFSISVRFRIVNIRFRCSQSLSCQFYWKFANLIAYLIVFYIRTQLWNVVECYCITAPPVVFSRNHVRFPFDQMFRFEIPGIPCDERNNIFRFIELTRPRSSGSKFRAKIRKQTEHSFIIVYLLWGCSTTLKLK